MLATVLASACEQAPTTLAPAAYQVQFLVANELVAPVTITIDGEPYAILQGGRSTSLTVLSSRQWLTWVSAKPMDARGVPIPDDIGDVRMSIAGIRGTLEISNIIQDQTYVTARIFNASTSPVSIGVFDGSTVSCASALPGAAGAVLGFTQIGYYRLLPATEIRAYRDPSRCTGTYVAWSPAQLQEFVPRSGLLTLLLDAAP